MTVNRYNNVLARTFITTRFVRARQLEDQKEQYRLFFRNFLDYFNIVRCVISYHYPGPVWHLVDVTIKSF